MAEIKLKIHNCEQCPYLVAEAAYGSDSFQVLQNWRCSISGNRSISEYIEVFESSKIPIPKWCPIFVKEDGK